MFGNDGSTRPRRRVRDAVIVVSAAVAVVGVVMAVHAVRATPSSAACRPVAQQSTAARAAPARRGPAALKVQRVRDDPAISEFGYTRDGAWAGWSQNSEQQPRRYQRYAVSRAGDPIAVGPPVDSRDGAVSGGRMLYSTFRAHHGGDLVWFDLGTGRKGMLPDGVNTGADEMAPKVSCPWVLFSRERYDDMDLRLYNASTGEMRVVARGYNGGAWLQPGQVNAGWATWDQERGAGIDAFVYEIATGTTTKIPRATPAQMAPAVASDGTVYYLRADSYSNCPSHLQLAKYSPGGPAVVLHAFPADTSVWDTYVGETADGSRHVYFTLAHCRAPDRSADGIYQLVDPSAGR